MMRRILASGGHDQRSRQMEGPRDSITQRTEISTSVSYPPCIDLYFYFIRYSTTALGPPTHHITYLYLYFTFDCLFRIVNFGPMGENLMFGFDLKCIDVFIVST